jgi:hypothetical protein
LDLWRNVNRSSRDININSIALDLNENIYVAGRIETRPSNDTFDHVLLKLSSTTGSLDPLFNAFLTSGFSVFDVGMEDNTQLYVVVSDINRIFLINVISSIGDDLSLVTNHVSFQGSIQIRASYLIQDDN